MSNITPVENLDANLLTMVRRFMQIGGHTVQQRNPRQASLYLGLQLEEMAEKIEILRNYAEDGAQHDSLFVLCDVLEGMAARAKNGEFIGIFQDIFYGKDSLQAHADLVDSDVDLAWVSIGALLSSCNDGQGVVNEVARANMEKYPNGEVLRDENGKIRKPADWHGPEHLNFL